MRLFTLLKNVINEINSIKSQVKINLTRDTYNVPPASTYTCYYYPGVNMCFARIGVEPRNTTVYSAGESYILYTVPTGYRPGYVHAGSVHVGGTNIANVRINSGGEITLIPKTNISVGWAVYVTLWWKVV